jgi:phage antirepressor YoqD-like protein
MTITNKITQFDLSIFEVNKETKTINLTKMAERNGKNIKHWLANKQTKEFLDAFRLENAEDGIPPIAILKGGDGLQGTFGTREVALELSRWISPKFSVWCNKQIDTLFQEGKVELMPSNLPVPSYQVNDPISRAKLWILEYEEKIKLEAKIEQDKPILELANNYLVNGANVNLSTCAKTLRITLKDFKQILYSKYIFIQRGNEVPYSDYAEWFFCKPYVAKNGHSGTQLLVTPIGIEKLSKIINNQNLLQTEKLLELDYA